MLRLHDHFDVWVRETPEAELAAFGARSMTYAAAAEHVHRLANALLGCGLRRGDRFAYLSKNSIELGLMFYAASKAGVVPVPLNYRLAPPEWQYIINDALARLLIVRGDYVAAIDPIRATLVTVERCIAVATAAPPAGWEDYDAFVAAAPATPPDVAVAAGDD